jgi:hypothetical protein
MFYFLWDLMAQSLSVLPSLFLVALSWLSIQVSDLITARARDEGVRAALARLDDAVFTAVREVEQVLVIPLKRASASGRLGIANRAAASTSAVKTARACFGAKGWPELGAALGLSSDDLERMLAARVEAAVCELHGQPARIVGNALRVVLRSARGDEAVPDVADATWFPCSKFERDIGVQ